MIPRIERSVKTPEMNALKKSGHSAEAIKETNSSS
jgi:hypothetical protein